MVDGGALVIENDNNEMVIAYSHFTGNTAQQRGGAMYLGWMNEDTTISYCTFENNSAGTAGGGLFLLRENAVASISDSSFVSNTAMGERVAFDPATYSSTQASGAGGGGAVFIDSYNSQVSFSRCHFMRNSAPYASGGALVLAISNTLITIASSAMEANYAYREGGALFLGLTNFAVEVVDTAVLNNRAEFVGGGGIFAMARNSVSLLRVAVSANRSGMMNNVKMFCCYYVSFVCQRRYTYCCYLYSVYDVCINFVSLVFILCACVCGWTISDVMLQCQGGKWGRSDVDAQQSEGGH